MKKMSLNYGYYKHKADFLLTKVISDIITEPHREKTGFLPRRKQRRRSASR